MYKYKTKSYNNYTTEQRKEYQSNIQNKMKELEDMVNSTETNEQYLTWLSVISNFHRYSFMNKIMIFTQYPSARYVGSYGLWKKIGNPVASGAKGLAIFAPITKPMMLEEIDEATHESKTKKVLVPVGYKMTYVFDISQTVDPTFDVLTFGSRITDVTEEATKLYETFIDKVQQYGLIVSEVEIFGKSNGSTNGKEINIRIDNNTNEKLSTIIHELAHCILNHHTLIKSGSITTQEAELEAESCAYVILTQLGQPTKSVEYLKTWNKDGSKSLMDILSRVSKGVDEINSILGLKDEQTNNESEE